MKLANTKMIFTVLLIICVFSSTILLTDTTTSVSKDHQGVWSVQSISWILSDTTYRIEKAQPGFLHLSQGRYSFIWTPTPTQRVPFESLAKPSNDEMVQGFQSIVLNAGRYSISDNQISVTAEIAKVPGFEGGSQIFDYAIDQDTMTYTMVDETYPTGQKPSWYGKMKTQFKLLRIE